MRQRNVERDGRMQDVYDVRNGETSRLLPGMFPDIWPNGRMYGKRSDMTPQAASTRRKRAG